MCIVCFVRLSHLLLLRLLLRLCLRLCLRLLLLKSLMHTGMGSEITLRVTTGLPHNYSKR